jgi:3-hydroxybutyryl-CoA dehydrogenase
MEGEAIKAMAEIEKIGVIGAGIMGNGIAQVAAQGGYRVAMMDLNDKCIQNALDSIKSSLGRMTRKGKINQETVTQIMNRITGTLDMIEAAGDADLVIEAVPEDLDLKRETFKQLEDVCPAHTVLASNTSTISITAIASATQRSDKVIGMHFANPVPIMMGVEVIRGLDTSEDTMRTVLHVLERMGKQYYVVEKDAPGFVGNRAFPLFLNEAFNLLWEGIATPEAIDKGMKVSLGHPMGPLELADLIGLDQLLKGLEYLHRELGEKFRPSPKLKQLVAAGYFGRKSGRGVYDYTGSKK